MKARYKRVLAAVVLVGIVGLSVLRYLFEGWDVHGNAMAPTLPDGAFVVSQRTLGSVSRGDVVVVATAPDGTPSLLTRVIGVAGDTVALHGPDVLLNGQQLQHEATSADGVVVDETLEAAKYPVSLGGQHLGPEQSIRVPGGHVFVLSDNRGAARDSRVFGPVPVDQVEYRVVLQLPSRR